MSATQPAGSPPMPDQKQKDERTWATFCHLAALAGFVGVPLGSVIGPLVVWLIKRNELPLVDREGKKALDFQITILIFTIPAVVLCFFCIGIPLLIAIWICDIVLPIVAAVKTNNGEDYRYPFSFAFVK